MLDKDKEARNDVRDIKIVFLRHLERGQLNRAGTAIKPKSIVFQSGNGGEVSNVIDCDVPFALSISSSASNTSNCTLQRSQHWSRGVHNFHNHNQYIASQKRLVLSLM